MHMDSIRNGAPAGRLPLLLLLAGASLAFSAEPRAWISRGPGGGGAFYGPSINPFDPDEMYVKSDMSDAFRTRDAGRSWATVDFRALQGGSQFTCVQFASNTLVRYALSGSDLRKSTDGGESWQATAFSGAYSTWADPAATNRVLAADYSTLHLSTNGGASFSASYASSDLHIGGVFWDGQTVLAGARPGLLVSTNGGRTFGLSAITGLPASEAIVSFAGAKQGSGIRLFCVTLGSGDVYPGVQGWDYGLYQGVYRLDYPTGTWTLATTGIGGDYPFFAGMCRTNIDTAYLAGHTDSPESAPVVFKTTNGGGAWSRVFLAYSNRNITTGWQGFRGDRDWSYGEYALGFNVCPTDPNRAILTDLGFVYVTTNGGAQWYSPYVASSDENPTNAATPKQKSYHGVGLEDTSCWYMEWFDSNTVFTCYTDMRGVLSTNGGRSWYFPSTLTQNSTYETARHPTNGLVYAAISSVHDLYAWDRYCQDAYIDGGSGAILYSTNKGATWQTFKNLGRPIVALALDSNNHNRLYASMVNSTSGGIYRTTNLGAGTGSAWSKLPNPPRTQGHPYVIRILNDGTIVCSYSARIASGNFQASSGVFVSTDDGASWQDRTAAGMMYYTKDVVIDPHDAAQNRWYAGVWGEWGNSSGHGGLYMTTNRGISWTRISTNLVQVGSVTLDPWRSNDMLVCTENDGLWFCTNRYAAVPAISPATNYPFRFPSRAFFNPWNTNEVWVTSFGNGMRLGRLAEPEPAITRFHPDTPSELTVNAASGQRIILGASTNLFQWQDTATNVVLEDTMVFTNAPAGSPIFYRARVAP
jgi:photosystem II stability/assembly factor-like uncharacterized protein